MILSDQASGKVIKSFRAKSLFYKRGLRETLKCPICEDTARGSFEPEGGPLPDSESNTWILSFQSSRIRSVRVFIKFMKFCYSIRNGLDEEPTFRTGEPEVWLSQ